MVKKKEKPEVPKVLIAFVPKNFPDGKTFDQFESYLDGLADYHGVEPVFSAYVQENDLPYPFWNTACELDEIAAKKKKKLYSEVWIAGAESSPRLEKLFKKAIALGYKPRNLAGAFTEAGKMCLRLG